MCVGRGGEIEVDSQRAEERQIISADADADAHTQTNRHRQTDTDTLSFTCTQ